jgi:hypothetical protein
MDTSEFIDVLERLRTRLSASKTKEITRPAERTNIQAVVGAWFSQYRPSFVQIVGEESYIVSMDEEMQILLALAAGNCSRWKAIRSTTSALQHFKENLLVPLSRAYWSRAPERSPAGRDPGVANRLKQLEPELAESYEQAVVDIEDSTRVSYRGQAAELREVLTGVLHKLAPNSEVQATDWYRDARKSGARSEPTPTRAERTKFILRSRQKGSAVTESAESYTALVEQRLGDVVSATYKRGSAATHGGTERAELVNVLPYMNALLRELLPPLS